MFEYNFPASNSGPILSGTVLDVSGAGHNGTASGFTDSSDRLSDNVPAGKSGKSINFGTIWYDDDRISVDDTSLMSTRTVASYGGFTMDAWIYSTDPSPVYDQAIIASRLTTLVIDNNRIGVNFYNGGTGAWAPIVANTWYHATMTFDTLGNPAVASTQFPGAYGVTGVATVYLDGKEVASQTVTYDPYGDSSTSYGVAVGMYSVGTWNGFAGLIYDPSLKLGVAVADARARHRNDFPDRRVGRFGGRLCGARRRS